MKTVRPEFFVFVAGKIPVHLVHESLGFGPIRKGVTCVPEEARKIVKVLGDVFVAGHGIPFCQPNQVDTKVSHRGVCYSRFESGLSVVAADGRRRRV